MATLAPSIFIDDHGLGPRHCGSEMVRLALSNGHPIYICAVEYKGLDPDRLLHRLIVDLSAANLVADVRTPRDAFLVMQVASSFKPAGIGRRNGPDSWPAT
jgi:hypothetical protein